MAASFILPHMDSFTWRSQYPRTSWTHTINYLPWLQTSGGLCNHGDDKEEHVAGTIPITTFIDIDRTEPEDIQFKISDQSEVKSHALFPSHPHKLASPISWAASLSPLAPFSIRCQFLGGAWGTSGRQGKVHGIRMLSVSSLHSCCASTLPKLTLCDVWCRSSDIRQWSAMAIIYSLTGHRATLLPVTSRHSTHSGWLTRLV